MVPEIKAEEITWQLVGDEETDPPTQEWTATRLLAHIRVAGVDLHLEAIEIYHDAEGMQSASDPWLESDLRAYSSASGAEGHWQEFEHDGRTYVLFATPFC